MEHSLKRFFALCCIIFVIGAKAGLLWALPFCNVNGEIRNFPENEYLFLTDLWKGNVIDTAKVEGGQFHFKFPVKNPIYVSITYQGNSLFQFFAEKGSLFLQADMRNVNAFTLVGSASHQKWKDFNQNWHSFYTKYLELNQIKNNILREDLWYDFQPKAEDFLIRYFQKEKTGYVTGFALIQTGNYLSPETKKNILKALSPQNKKGEYVNTFAKITANENRFLGTKVSTFEWIDTEGKSHTPAQYEGTYLLIDCWAAWCKPCRQYNRSFKVLKDSATFPFAILSLSIDTEKYAFLKALEEDVMPWSQIFIEEGSADKWIKYYEIHALPANILVNPEGIIIAKNLKPEKIMPKIRAVLK